MSTLSPITILARKMKDVDGTVCKLETIIMEKIYDQIVQLSHMWNEVGIFGIPLEDRCNSIADQVLAFMEDLLEDEEQLIRDLKSETEKLLLKIVSLCHDLNLSFDEPDERMTILEKKRVLTKLNSFLEEEKFSRTKKWNELQKEIKESNRLMKTLHSNFESSVIIPTPGDLEVLQMQADDVKWELCKRMKQMHELKQTIKRLVGELDHKVEQQDRIYLADEVGDLLYSSENLKLHKTFLAKLEKIKKVNMSKIATYKEELKKPCEFKLDTEEIFKEEEFGYFCPASGNLVKALKEKVLERRKKIESMVRSKQAELKQWWEKCQVSCEHKDGKKDLLNGDLEKLDCKALKEEILKMESYYHNNKEILDLHKTFRDTFADLSEAERKCINASRRLNNMGSTIEDKPRNKLLRDVSRIKQKLISKVELEEHVTETKLLFKGLHLSEYLEQMQNELQSNMDAWKIDGCTPASSRHHCCGNHKTPTSQRREEGSCKNFKRNGYRLSNRQQTSQDSGQSTNPKRDSHNLNYPGKNGTNSKPPRPASGVRRSATSNHVVPRSARTKTCRPVTENKAADTRIEISEIENVDENFLDATASYEEFYNNLASSDSFISSSILENPNSPKKMKKRQFFMPPFRS